MMVLYAQAWPYRTASQIEWWVHTVHFLLSWFFWSSALIEYWNRNWGPVWGIALAVLSYLGRCWTHPADLTWIQTPHNLFRVFRADGKFTNSLVKRESSSLGPSLSPYLSSSKYSRRLFQKTSKGFDCKISWGSAAARLGRFGLASTQGVS